MFFPIDRQMGVCAHCNDLVAMERFPDQDVFERAKKLHPKFCGTRFRMTIHELVEKDAGKALARREGFRVLETVMKLRRRPVCLVCGGDEVQPTPKPRGLTSNTKFPICLGMSHPLCGGLLWIKGSEGARIGVNSVTKFYDIFGQILIKDKKRV